MTQKLNEEPLINPFAAADEFREYMDRTEREIAAMRYQMRLLIQCVTILMEQAKCVQNPLQNTSSEHGNLNPSFVTSLDVVAAR